MHSEFHHPKPQIVSAEAKRSRLACPLGFNYNLPKAPTFCTSQVLPLIVPNSGKCIYQIAMGTSLVAQWLRRRLPVQGTGVWSLVRDDPTCRRAAKPVHHNYWACALEPTSHNYWARAPRARALATREATAMRSQHTATRGGPCSHN